MQVLKRLIIEGVIIDGTTHTLILGTERFGSVPKVYARTGLIKFASSKQQNKMLKNWSVEQHLLARAPKGRLQLRTLFNISQR